jgi:hypothetical protein
MQRPASVLFIAILVAISGFFDLIFGIWMLLAPWVDQPTITDLTGGEWGAPNYFFVINGGLSIILGLMYFWLTKMTLVGTQTAYVLINFLAILNLFYGLFRLPYGWGVMALNVLVLILANTDKAKAWFRQGI